MSEPYIIDRENLIGLKQFCIDYGNTDIGSSAYDYNMVWGDIEEKLSYIGKRIESFEGGTLTLYAYKGGITTAPYRLYVGINNGFFQDFDETYRYFEEEIQDEEGVTIKTYIVYTGSYSIFNNLHEGAVIMLLTTNDLNVTLQDSQNQSTFYNATYRCRSNAFSPYSTLHVFNVPLTGNDVYIFTVN